MARRRAAAGATWHTVLYMRNGSGTEIGCNDDDTACTSATIRQSTISGAASGPGLYGIFVDGFGSASGAYTVTVSGL